MRSAAISAPTSPDRKAGRTTSRPPRAATAAATSSDLYVSAMTVPTGPGGSSASASAGNATAPRLGTAPGHREARRRHREQVNPPRRRREQREARHGQVGPHIEPRHALCGVYGDVTGRTGQHPRQLVIVQHARARHGQVSVTSVTDELLARRWVIACLEKLAT